MLMAWLGFRMLKTMGPVGKEERDSADSLPLGWPDWGHSVRKENSTMLMEVDFVSPSELATSNTCIFPESAVR
jgi:hypothetical protein